MGDILGLLKSLLIPIVGIAGALLIIKRPYWGLILLCGSLPVAYSLPTVQGLTSISVPLGAITVASFIINRIINSKTIKINPLSMVIYILTTILTGLMVLGQWLHPATLQIRNYGSGMTAKKSDIEY